ncbi:hypothetical protein ACQEU3_12995 [Spirillospora sp. CA-253888]
MREAVRRLLRERHVDLVRFAYLALDDGADAPDLLLVRARRAVRQAAAGRAATSYAELRGALCAELLAGPPPARLRWFRLLAEAAPGTAGPARAALREASPHERLVCLLGRLEGLTSPEVAAELGERMMLDTWHVDRTLAELDTASGLDAAGQRAELRAFDPTLMRVRPPMPRRRLPAVALAALLLAGTLLALQQRDDPSGDPLVVGGDVWRRTSSPLLEHWPTRGPLSGDAALLRRAADAWRRDRREPPVGRIAVLYAGRVDGAAVVVLRDSPGYRNAPMIADYYERRLSRGVESLNRLGGASGQLIMLGPTWRFLAPPWLTDVRVARPSDAVPRWAPVRVDDGLSDPVPWSWIGPRCQNYLAFAMTHRPATGGWPRPLLQLAAQTAGTPTSRVWFRGDLMRDTRAQWAALRAAACESIRSLSETGDLRIGRLWEGGLPGGDRAWLLTIDTSVPWGAPGTAALVSPDGRALSERGRTNGDYAASGETMAAAVWWRSARRWHLVAAAGPGVAELRVVGDLGTHRARGRGPVLTVPGPAVRRPDAQDVRELPVVQVVAVEPDGDRTLLGPS